MEDNKKFKIGSWIIKLYRNKNNNKFTFDLEDTKSGYSDNAIVYEPGKIAFYNPYRIPEKVKSFIRKYTIENKEIFERKNFQFGVSDTDPFIEEMSTVGGIAGFNSPMKSNKKKVKKNILYIKNLYEESLKTDLSKIENSAAFWLERHFQELNKAYTDREKTLQILSTMPEGHGISHEFKDKFINTVKNFYQKGPKMVLKFLYDSYLKGANLGLNENISLNQGLKKQWLSLIGIHEFLTKLGAIKQKNSGDWKALYKLHDTYLGVKDNGDYFSIEEI